VGTVLSLAFVAIAGPAAIAADDPGDGIGIDVRVIGPSSAPTPSVTPTKKPSGGGASTPEPSATSDPADDLGDDAIDLGGVLYVGGLRGEIAPSVGARGGKAELSITVRNTSNELTDLGLRFWLKNAVGATIGEVSHLAVRDLKPDETRTVRTSITTVGQWTFYTAHVTVTPPKVLDGVKLDPITRDTALFVPPYFLLVIGGATTLLYLVIRYLIVRRLFGVGGPA